MRSKLDGAVLTIAAASFALAAGAAAAETAAEIPTRTGQTVRFLLEKPERPVGSVILLAGGHGNLALGADGRIGWGRRNQLVRTRSSYAKAGFITAVPDIAPDLKKGRGGVDGYRWSSRHARDIGALVKHLRGMAEPVHLVGTSRAALSVANGAARLSGPEAPDAIVITSGMLMDTGAKQPSVQRNVGRLQRIKQPTLIAYHAGDQCAYTRPSSGTKFKPLLTGAKKVDVTILKGGTAGSGPPCEANSPHGFIGMDGEVVRVVTTWLKSL